MGISHSPALSSVQLLYLSVIVAAAASGAVLVRGSGKGCSIEKALLLINSQPQPDFTGSSGGQTSIGATSFIEWFGIFTTSEVPASFSHKQAYFRYTLPPQGTQLARYYIRFGLYTAASPPTLLYQGVYKAKATSKRQTETFTVTVGVSKPAADSPSLTSDTDYYLAWWSPNNFQEYYYLNATMQEHEYAADYSTGMPRQITGTPEFNNQANYPLHFVICPE